LKLGRDKEEYRKRLEYGTEMANKLTTFFGIVCIAAGTGYITKPYVTSLFYQYILRIPPVYEYIFQGDFYFDTVSSPGYEIRVFIESYLMIYLVLFNVSFCCALNVKNTRFVNL